MAIKTNKIISSVSNRELILEDILMSMDIKTINGESLLGGGDITFNANGSTTSTTNSGSTAGSTLGAQALLISGVNIKTVDGQSLLGSGNIVIGGQSPMPVIQTSVSSLFERQDVTITILNYDPNESYTITVDPGMPNAFIGGFTHTPINTNNGTFTVTGDLTQDKDINIKVKSYSPQHGTGFSEEAVVTVFFKALAGANSRQACDFKHSIQ